MKTILPFPLSPPVCPSCGRHRQPAVTTPLPGDALWVSSNSRSDTWIFLVLLVCSLAAVGWSGIFICRILSALSPGDL